MKQAVADTDGENKDSCAKYCVGLAAECTGVQFNSNDTVEGKAKCSTIKETTVTIVDKALDKTEKDKTEPNKHCTQLSATADVAWNSVQ